MPFFQSGSVARNEIKSVMALVHGGAGPADGVGIEADSIRTAMEQVLLDASGLRPTEAESSAAGGLGKAESFVLNTIHAFERHPKFNAGYGSAIQSDGIVRVSAGFMESTRKKHSAVINATHVLHPSMLAWYLQFEEAGNVLDATGADFLARKLTMPVTDLVSPQRFETWVERRRKQLRNQNIPTGTGTVGCVAIDTDLQLAACTSTGGTGNESVGRVGDTPTVAGNFCSGRVAISCTGIGEHIVNSGFAVRVATRIDDGMSLTEAFEKSIWEAVERGFEFAAIALGCDQSGQTVNWIAGSCNRHLSWAAILPSETVWFSKPPIG